jgi:hypothetical protein
MKHAGAQALDRLSGLLESVRQMPGLQERKPGIFYRTGSAFLHFHEAPAGLFADAKFDGKHFERVDVTQLSGQAELLSRLETFNAAADSATTAKTRARR